MNLNKIYLKYKDLEIKKTGLKYTYEKTKNSKKIHLIGNEYFIDTTVIPDKYDNDIILRSNDDDIYESMSSLDIEGIGSSKASSSKASDAANKFFNGDIADHEAELTNELKLFEKSLAKKAKDQADNAYNDLPEKSRPSRIDFYRDFGFNLARNIILDDNLFKFGDKASLAKVYSALTLFGNALEESERLEEGSIYRKSGVDITDGFNIIDKGLEPSLVSSSMDELLKLFENPTEYNNLQFASIIHFLFVEIHPYYDGNGRMARLLLKAISTKENGGGFWGMHVNKIISWMKNPYSKSIKLSRETKDLTYFSVFMDYVYNISFFTEVIIYNENNRLLESENKKTITGLKPSILCYFLTLNTYRSWKDVQKDIIGGRELTEQRIKGLLNEMIEMDLLKRYKVDSNNVYALSDRLTNSIKEMKE